MERNLKIKNDRVKYDGTKTVFNKPFFIFEKEIKNPLGKCTMILKLT